MQTQDNSAKLGFLAKKHQLAATLGLFFLFLSGLSSAQITPLGDAYTNSADPTTKYGSATTLAVDGASEITYIQFNLGSIPSGATIGQATLKLYVNSVTTAGSFNVDYVTGSWAESTIDSSNAPALGNTIASNVAITTADKNQYILINVTSAVQAWLNGSETNNGLALVANGSFNATFDSKENTTTSHPAELDIVLAGGEGTITGVTTASGSGLTGGGTSGTLDLSLTTACSSGQVLSWNGSSWACAALSGGGTITGVTAGTALTGGGTSGNVTLNLNTTQVPLLAANNTFTGNQTVNGNLSATGIVTGSAFQIGSNVFDYGSYSNNNAFVGFAGNTSMTGGWNTAGGVLALQSNTSGIENTAFGYAALQGNTAAGANTAIGWGTLQVNGGSFNTATGYSALTSNTTGFQNTATGAGALSANTKGAFNTATGLDALESNTAGNSNTATGNGALADNTGGNNNTATGFQALLNNTSGNNNTADGYQALYSNTGSSNTATGYQALQTNTSGTDNTAIGYQALQLNKASGANTAIGSSALANTTGGQNTAIGNTALSSNTSGSNNTATGNGSGLTTDLSSVTGSYDNFLGAFSGMSTGSLQDATAIGACATVSASNALVLGAAGETLQACTGLPGEQTNVGINVSNPSRILTVLQGGGHAIADGWDTYSSRRWKTNIQPLHDALSKVGQLRGVSYDLKDSGKHEIGVIAEEVGAVVPEVVSWEKNGKDAQGVDYSRLTALLIEAVKQQQQEISSLQAQLKKRAAKEAMLESRLAHLEQNGHTQLAAAHPVQ